MMMNKWIGIALTAIVGASLITLYADWPVALGVFFCLWANNIGND